MFSFSNKTWLILIVFSGFILRILAALNAHLTSDELYSIWLARHSLAGFFSHCAFNDVQAPAHVFFLHFWSLVSQEEIWLRLFSVIPGTVVVIISYNLGICVLNNKFGLLTATLSSFSPLLISHSAIIRYDSLTVLFTALSLLYFVRICISQQEEKNNYIFYTIWTILGVFSFYYVWFLILAENITLLVLFCIIRLAAMGDCGIYKNKILQAPGAGKWKYWAAAQTTIVLFFLLWIPYFTQQYRLASHGGHELPPVFSIKQVISDSSGAIRGIEPAYSVHKVITTYYGVMERQQRWSLLFFTIIIWFGMKTLKSELNHSQNHFQKYCYWLLPLLCVIIIAAAIIAHYTINLFFSWRYFYFITIIITILPASAIYKSAKNILTAKLLGTVMLFLFLLANPLFHQSSYTEPWKEIADYIKTNAGQSGAVLFHGKRGASIYTYYNMGNIPFVTVPEDIATDDSIATMLFPPVKIEYHSKFMQMTSNYKRIMVIWGYPTTPHRNYGTNLIKEWLKQENFYIIKKEQFGILPVEIYKRGSGEKTN